MDLPTYEELIRALDASPALPPELERRLAAAGAEGRRRLRLVEELLAALRAGPLPEVPEHLRAAALAAISIGRPGHASTERASIPARRSLSRRIAEAVEHVGALVLDSLGAGPRPAATCLRGEELSERHLLFQAGPYAIDLARLATSVVVGQVLPADSEAPGLADGVCALDGGSSVLQTRIEPNGDFRFESVPEGEYRMLIEGEGVRLVFPAIDLSA